MLTKPNRQSRIVIQGRQESAIIKPYIEERNGKVGRVSNLLKHRAFSNQDTGILEFSGLRQMGDTRAVLFKRDNEMLVMKITESQYRKFKTIKVGSSVKVAANGRVSSVNG